MFFDDEMLGVDDQYFVGGMKAVNSLERMFEEHFMETETLSRQQMFWIVDRFREDVMALKTAKLLERAKDAHPQDS